MYGAVQDPDNENEDLCGNNKEFGPLGDLRGNPSIDPGEPSTYDTVWDPGFFSLKPKEIDNIDKPRYLPEAKRRRHGVLEGDSNKKIQRIVVPHSATNLTLK